MTLIEEIVQDLRKTIPCELYDHCVRTMDTAVDIARRGGFDETACAVAALLHDYCRHLPGARLLRLATELGIVIDDVERDSPLLLHGPVAAVLVARDFGVTEPRVLDAIRYHTTGRAGMCAVEQVVYIADKIEPGKSSTVGLRLEEVRPAPRSTGRAVVDGEDPLKRFLLEHANHTIMRLVKSGMAMHPHMVEMRNWIIRGEG